MYEVLHIGVTNWGGGRGWGMLPHVEKKVFLGLYVLRWHLKPFYTIHG